jgi:hypothetical protein
MVFTSHAVTHPNILPSQRSSKLHSSPSQQLRMLPYHSVVSKRTRPSRLKTGKSRKDPVTADAKRRDRTDGIWGSPTPHRELSPSGRPALRAYSNLLSGCHRDRTCDPCIICSALPAELDTHKTFSAEEAVVFYHIVQNSGQSPHVASRLRPLCQNLTFLFETTESTISVLCLAPIHFRRTLPLR